jgi:ABC-type transport system substrate-binding protein
MNQAVLKARLERDPEARIAQYQTILKRFQQDGPFFYIYQQMRNLGVHSQLKEIQASAFKVWYTTAVK